MMASIVAMAGGGDSVEDRVRSTLVEYTPTPNLTAIDPELYRALVLSGHHKHKKFDVFFAVLKPLVDPTPRFGLGVGRAPFLMLHTADFKYGVTPCLKLVVAGPMSYTS